MIKKLALLVTIFGICTQKPFCSDNNALSVEGDNARVFTSTKGNCLVITPKYTQNNFVDVQIKDRTLTVNTSPHSPHLTFSSERFQNVLRNEVFRDIHTNEFVCIKTSHKFHNKGYVHSASKQKYVDCSFNFTKFDAKVRLTSTSQTLSFAENTVKEIRKGEPLLNLFSSVVLSNLSPACTDFIQKNDGSYDKLGILASISVSPLKQAREVPFSAYLDFPNSSFHIVTQGTVLEFEPNPGYFFTK